MVQDAVVYLEGQAKERRVMSLRIAIIQEEWDWIASRSLTIDVLGDVVGSDGCPPAGLSDVFKDKSSSWVGLIGTNDTWS